MSNGTFRTLFLTPASQQPLLDFRLNNLVRCLYVRPSVHYGRTQPNTLTVCSYFLQEESSNVDSFDSPIIESPILKTCLSR